MIFQIIVTVVLVLLAIFWANSPIKTTAGQIYETESAYNYIQVLEKDGYRYLRLNEGQGIHSIWHPSQLVYDGPWEQFLVAPFFNAPDFGLQGVGSPSGIYLCGDNVGTNPAYAMKDVTVTGNRISNAAAGCHA